MCTPNRQFLPFVDGRCDQKSLLEHLTFTNENLACKTMLDCCNALICFIVHHKSKPVKFSVERPLVETVVGENWS